MSTHCTDIIDQGHWRHLELNEYASPYLRIGDSIYGGYLSEIELYKHLTPLKGVDANSFEICEESEYARDNKHIYYPLLVTCVDAETWGACYMVEYIVPNASPRTFKYIKDDYGVDSGNMYAEGHEIEWDDSVLNIYVRRRMSPEQIKYFKSLENQICDLQVFGSIQNPYALLTFKNGDSIRLWHVLGILHDGEGIYKKVGDVTENSPYQHSGLRVVNVEYESPAIISLYLEDGYQINIEPEIYHQARYECYAKSIGKCYIIYNRKRQNIIERDLNHGGGSSTKN